LVTSGLISCGQQQQQQHGAAEQAGKKIDKVLDQTKQSAVEAADAAGEAAKKGGQKLQEAGQEMKEKADSSSGN
jgi:methyl-accepting chemotaxis protein